MHRSAPIGKLPLWLFQLAPAMGEAELRITLHILRQTAGWGKERDLISLTQFEAGTGLSRQGVIDGIRAALERGHVQRSPRGLSFVYWLAAPGEHQGEGEEAGEVIHKGEGEGAAYPQPVGGEGAALVSPADTQRTLRGEPENMAIVDNFAMLRDISRSIEAGGAAPLQDLAGLAGRAARLGMTPGDLFALWTDCQRWARCPAAFLVWALTQGKGRPPRPPRRGPGLARARQGKGGARASRVRADFLAEAGAVFVAG